MTKTGLVNISYHQPIPVDVMWHGGPTARWPSGLRPVDVKFDNCGRLFVSSDGTRRQGGSSIVILTQCTNSSNLTTNGTRAFECLDCDDTVNSAGDTFRTIAFGFVLFNVASIILQI
mmetsp:Transcript_52474/g.63216  ORF Transcript_52474/g.63216 Transcript_52474/m.63216 type:complete len:117 (-) Transcript_52474:32-382(-)